jgi:prolyl-tRNA synthetase
MYTFDTDLSTARETYEAVNEQYAKIMHELNVPFVKIDADTGTMGGKISHEYHLITPIGEDSIITCTRCWKSINKELAKDDKICPKCDSVCLENQQGIEIAHTFILEDRYSKPLKATFLNNKGKPENLQMGCYGIGITRLIASCIEFLSNENEIRWPEKLAPYQVCVIPPKEGSKEEAVVGDIGNKVYQNLLEHLSDEVVIDDRTSMTIGKRLLDMKKLGIPHVIVIGSKATEENPIVEVHNLNSNEVLNLSVNDALNYVVKSCR